MRVESDKPVKTGGWIHELADPRPFVAPKAEPERPNINWSDQAGRMFRRGEEARQELAATLGVSAESLRRLGVGAGIDYDGRHFYSFPERQPGGKVCGIVRRFRDGSKKTMKGSRSGLYFEARWLDYQGPIFLPEGGSDTASLITLGLRAVGRPSNLGGIKHLLAILRRVARPIIVLGEHDEKPQKRGQSWFCPANCKGCLFCFPGLAGAKHTAKKLREACGSRVRVAMPPNGAKDVREWLIKHGEPGGGRKFLEWIRSMEA